MNIFNRLLTLRNKQAPGLDACYNLTGPDYLVGPKYAQITYDCSTEHTYIQDVFHKNLWAQNVKVP